MSGRQPLITSHNDYDWPGDGIYFWEHSAERAFAVATEVAARPRHPGQKVTRPAVVGAIIDLGLCLNLLDTRFTSMVQRPHTRLAGYSAASGLELPRNSGGSDLLRRNLDCAVLRTLHSSREDEGEPPFDTVRAAFIEGDRLYENAGFSAKNHIQISVRQIACIKGYFRPLDSAGRPITFR